MKIDELINRYYDGETTPSEEKLLREHFDHKNVNSAEKQIFNFFNSLKSDTLTDDFDEKLLNRILSEEKQSLKIEKLPKRKYSHIVTIAASFILIILLSWFAFYSPFETNKGIVIDDTNLQIKHDIALEQAERALMMIAGTFDDANDKLDKLEYINKSTKILEALNIFDL